MGFVQSLFTFFNSQSNNKTTYKEDNGLLSCIEQLKTVQESILFSNKKLIETVDDMNDYISLDIINKSDERIVDNKKHVKLINSCINILESKMNSK